jgi:hypothetical protein
MVAQLSEDGPALSSSCLLVSDLADPLGILVRHAPVLSIACNPETNTIVAGTELLSSQAVVAFW